MDLVKYQEEAIKTIKWRGTQELDCDHMIIGMFSEINEMIDAFKPIPQLKVQQQDSNHPSVPTYDIINIKEELGDMSWYIVNYATIRKINISQQTDVGLFSIQEYVYLTSKLSDLIKKWMIYNKPIENTIRMEEEQLVQKIINCICNFSYDLTTKININEVWDMNIEKLHKKRYKDAKYSDDQANNRDLKEERKALEGNEKV